MTVSEETAKRIADALERLIAVMERVTAPPQQYQHYPPRCPICHGFHFGTSVCPAWGRQ